MKYSKRTKGHTWSSCDFIIRSPDGKTYYIEVKATQGDDESVELGSSEVRLAIEKAGKRKEVFQIIHVLNALSTEPQFRFLPNPYDKKYRTKFRFEEAGLRIRYESHRWQEILQGIPEDPERFFPGGR